MDKSPWKLTVPEVIAVYKTSPTTGLSTQEVKEISKTSGPNDIKSQKGISKFSILIKQLKGPIVYILVSAAVVSAILGQFIDAAAILAIVLLNAIIGFTQEAQAEDSIEALKNLSVPKAKVRRDNQTHIIKSVDVVPGDLILLEAGDYVVADGRIIESYQLTSDESILTGESMPVEKNFRELLDDTSLAEKSNMLFASTAISNGTAKMVVTSIGMNTEIGHIAGLLEEDAGRKETPLQLRMIKLSNLLLMMGGGVIILVFILGYYQGAGWNDIFMSAISLAVATIPEGLPTVVTLALALAVRRMSKRNAIIRKMAAVETLGSTDIICTDKTGTLTTGKMRVREIFTLDEKQDEVFLQILVQCNNASIDNGTSGDPTEIALLLKAQESQSIQELKLRQKRIHEWSFDSDRKRMSVATLLNDEVWIYTKGAPESILPLCHLSEMDEKIVKENIEVLSRKGRRILALAYKRVSNLSNEDQDDAALVEKELSFKGLVAIADPPKEETIPAIKICKDSGIKVIMITGDHPLTAKAIADELGITDKGIFDGVLSGRDLDQMSSEQLQKKASGVAVYARVSPEHKLKIIKALEASGHIVSMTGDGVNDAPALKMASIGVAMGKAGTEVARQASSMILTDDNFATIVSAVEEGRAIYGNIKRTIQYLLSTNLAELLIMLGAVLIGLPIPLVPLSLLWINLVTDGLPSLALAAEPVQEKFLASSFRPSPNSFFDRSFLLELFFISILSTIIGLIVYYFGVKHFDIITGRSFIFSFLVYLCLFRSFSCRSETKTFFELPFNGFHLASVLIPVFLQIGLQNTQIFQELFKVKAIDLSSHAILIGISLIPVTLVELNKFRKRICL